MRKKLRLTPTPLILIVIAMSIFCSISSVASTLSGNIQSGALDGIDTLIVATDISPMQGVLNEHMQSNTAKEWDGAIVEKLKIFFQEEYQINVIPRRDYRSKDLSAKNIIVLQFTISARKEPLAGNDIVIVSLFPKLLKYNQGGVWTEIYTNGVGYPFIVAKDHGEFLKKLQDGAYFVTLSLFCGGLSNGQGACHQFFESLKPSIPRAPIIQDGLGYEIK